MRNTNLLAYVALVIVGGVLLMTIYAQLAPVVASVPARIGEALAGR